MLNFARNPSEFDSKTFDILVVGGGINGAACAWDAALRGFSVALIEAQDFGSAASAGCFKIVHGGLRYLQHLNIARLRESVREQQTLRLIAPHLVHPLPFLVPTYGYGMRGNEVLSLGMRLYELLSCDRNAEVPASHQLPNHRFLSADECLHIAPGLRQQGLRGGLVYYDCQMSNCDRLTLAVVQSAAAAGATVCNYLEATGFEMNGEQIARVAVRDRITSRESSIEAKLVINAAGPWSPLVERFIAPTESASPLYYSKGVQLVCKQFVKGYALAIESKESDPEARISRGGRSFFAHPWRGYSLLGTADILHKGSPENFQIRKEEVAQLLADAAEMYKEPLLKPENVLHAFGGLRPMPKQMLQRISSGYQPSEDEAYVSLKEEIIDHAHSQEETHSRASNLLTLVGVKYTTFRAFAEQVVDRCVEKLDAKLAPCQTMRTPVYGGSFGQYQSLLDEQREKNPQFSAELLQRLVRNYGSLTAEVHAIAEQRTELLQPLDTDGETIGAEVVFTARNEMSCSLQDVVFRRTGLGALGYPGDVPLRRAGEILAEELGWDDAKVQEEIEATRIAFPLLS